MSPRESDSEYARERTRPLDLLSLVAGALSVGLALLYLVADAAQLSVRPVGVAAVAAGALGAAGLAAAVRRVRR